MIHWPQHCDINLWALAMDYAVWVYNRTPRHTLGGLTPKEFWSGTRSDHADLKRAHVFAVPTMSLTPISKIESAFPNGTLVLVKECLLDSPLSTHPSVLSSSTWKLATSLLSTMSSLMTSLPPSHLLTSHMPMWRLSSKPFMMPVSLSSFLIQMEQQMEKQMEMWMEFQMEPQMELPLATQMEHPTEAPVLNALSMPVDLPHGLTPIPPKESTLSVLLV